MENREFAERIIRTADEYYYTAEEQWKHAGEIEPTSDETLFEFRRLIRNSMRFHLRALLVIDMVESDDDQSLEDLLEIVTEREEKLLELVEKNKAFEVLDEESTTEFSRLFAVAEAIRSFLLQTSAARAAALPYRLLLSDENQGDRTAESNG